MNTGIIMLLVGIHVHIICCALQDLAARNVLVSKDETCKVADFGIARKTVDDIYKVNKVSPFSVMQQPH